MVLSTAPWFPCCIACTAASDTKSGSGRGETQLLKLWDGNGHTTIRMS